SPQGGLGGGTPSGGMLSNTDPVAVQSRGRGNLDSEGWGGAGPLGASANNSTQRDTKHQQLNRLITSMVRPYSWEGGGMGGAGRVEYYDIGSALVVNQVADVIQEVADLLEALRRLQDLAIAVELRIVSLSETWYERMGVDFQMNIKTHTTKFE